MTTPSRYEEDSDSDGEPLYLWSRSQTPEENFNDAEGADENGNWSLSIVSEEMGYDNQIRNEIRWDTWRREDGTNNTYTEQDIPPTYLKSHMTRQQRKREKMARESRDIKIWSSTDIINTRTRLRAQAYEEKLAYTNDEPIPISDKLAALLFDKDVPAQKQPTPESSSEDSDVSGPSDGNDFEPDLPLTPPPSSRLRNRMSNTPASSRSGYKLPGSAQRARSPTASTLSSSSKGKGKEKQASTSGYRLPSTSSTSTSTGEEGATRSLPHRSARQDGSLNLRKLSSASIRSPKPIIGSDYIDPTCRGPLRIYRIAFSSVLFYFYHQAPSSSQQLTPMAKATRSTKARTLLSKHSARHADSEDYDYENSFR